MSDTNLNVRKTNRVMRREHKTAMPASVSRALETLKEIVHADTTNPECDAIYSHWLQSPNIRPPLLPDNLFHDRDRIFQELKKRLSCTPADSAPI